MVRRFPRRGSPHTFGWVRAPESDQAGYLAWETPAGEIVLLHHEVGTLVQFLPCLSPLPDLGEVPR